MENSKQKTCQVPMQDGKPCGRPLYDGETCICHSEKEDKDVELLQEELDRIFKTAPLGYNDLTAFFFPKKGFNLPSKYEKNTYFVLAKFSGDARFQLAIFSGYVSFSGAKFSREADFLGVEFSCGADFANVSFGGKATFWGCTFSKTASFWGAVFSEDATFQGARFSGEANLMSVAFSGDTDFKHATFSQDADLGGAKFLRKADFRLTKFSRRANFVLATFWGDADFSGQPLSEKTEFLGDAKFTQAKFEGNSSFRNTRFWGKTDFSFTVFKKRVDFYLCEVVGDCSLVLDGELNNRKVFDFDAKASLYEVADLLHLTFAEPEKVVFRKMSLARCKFLETDVSAVQFIDVTWDKKRKLIWSKRNAVYDESHPDNLWLIWKNPKTTEPKYEPPKFQYHLIAQLYRRLQTNYVNSYRYSEAGDFYIGEQEMIRKAKGSGWKIWRRWVCTNFIYKCLSYYGESFTLPLFWLLAVLFLFPLYLIYDGIIKDGYWNAFWKNLSFVTFNRADISKYVTEPYQQGIVTIEGLLLVVLVIFFVLALRRQYKRKTF